MKKVLVTGASGFIGRHCLPLLTQKGYEVYAISSKGPPFPSNTIKWIQFDFLRDNSIKKLLATVNPSHLLHFAWITTPGKLWESMENLAWLKSSIDLLEAFAFQGGKRAVFAGTCAEYDWAGVEFSENKTPCLPHTLYGSCKLALYLLVQSIAKQTGISQAWGRIFYLYGPHEYPQRFISTLIRGLLQKKQVPCSHCNQIKDFLHVEDVADAFVTLLDSQAQGAINIASGIGVTLKQVIQKITEQLGGKELIQFGSLLAPENEPASLIANTIRLKTELGWSPNYSLEEGINQTISWWKKVDFWEYDPSTSIIPTSKPI